MKNKLLLITFVMALAVGVLTSYASTYAETLFTYVRRGNTTEEGKIYYQLYPEALVDLERMPGLDDVYHYGYFDHLGSEMEAIDGVTNVYPYVGLMVEGDFEVDGKTIPLPSEPVVVVPYYREDLLDKNGEKIFISSALNKYLGKPQDVVVHDLRIPNGMSEKDSVEMKIQGQNVTVDVHRVDFDASDVSTFHIDKVVTNFYSSIYETDYAILLPYSQLMHLIEENQDVKKIPYDARMQVAFLVDNANYFDVMEAMQAVDEHVACDSYGAKMASALGTSVKKLAPQLSIVLALWIGLVVVHGWMSKKYKELDWKNYFLVLFIVSSLVHIIYSFFFQPQLRLFVANGRLGYVLLVSGLVHFVMLGMLFPKRKSRF